MEKEFIPYEQALALKELGFDEPCFKGYTEEYKELINFTSTHTNTSVKNTLPTKPFTAPTWQSAFKWFRKKYDLHNGIYPYYDEYEFQIKDFRLPTNTPIHGGLMKYEEAEIACLEKLIEIVESKKE
jgi:hypothetical protein